MTEAADEARRHPAGLCGRCRHHRKVGNRHGSTFYLCGRSATDARYARYPLLPVLRCEGYEDGGPDPWEALAGAGDE